MEMMDNVYNAALMFLGFQTLDFNAKETSKVAFNTMI
jgi:hypothetical protein